MATVMTNKELVKKLKDIATNYKTLYVMGCFGAPLTGSNVTRYCNNHSYNKKATRTKMIKKAADQNPPVYGFDCVCLIKGILWGWNGTASATYGGARYISNGVPDIGADTMITKCSDLSTDFSKIEVGEAVWMDGHIGVYIGDGLAVESSPKWDNGVQITACNCSKSGYNRRNWTKHGKLPYIEYVKEIPAQPEKTEQRTLKVGDRVKLAANATVYGKTYKFSSWVYKTKLYVREVDGNRIVVSTLKIGAVTGAVDIKYLTVVE